MQPHTQPYVSSRILTLSLRSGTQHAALDPAFNLMMRAPAQDRRTSDEAVDDLMALVRQVIPYDMAHNAEPEVVDLLLEVRLTSRESRVMSSHTTWRTTRSPRRRTCSSR